MTCGSLSPCLAPPWGCSTLPVLDVVAVETDGLMALSFEHGVWSGKYKLPNLTLWVFSISQPSQSGYLRVLTPFDKEYTFPEFFHVKDSPLIWSASRIVVTYGVGLEFPIWAAEIL